MGVYKVSDTKLSASIELLCLNLSPSYEVSNVIMLQLNLRREPQRSMCCFVFIFLYPLISKTKVNIFFFNNICTNN